MVESDDRRWAEHRGEEVDIGGGESYEVMVIRKRGECLNYRIGSIIGTVLGTLLTSLSAFYLTPCGDRIAEEMGGNISKGYLWGGVIGGLAIVAGSYLTNRHAHNVLRTLEEV